MSVKIELLCNCYTCKEMQRNKMFDGFTCMSTLHIEDPEEDPAGYWLKMNRPYDSNDPRMCRDGADGCPCWRQGVEVLPANSWYKEQTARSVITGKGL